jgi:phosphatidylserine decarboxylase
MSPLNVHVNRYPIGGDVTFAQHHKGQFLVAWHPKASTLNERTTVVVKGEQTEEVLYRQIAGAVARRIVMYARKGMKVKQGADSGFIKFGSRVDLFLPLNMVVDVKINDVVRGGETIIAHIEPNNLN